MKKSLTKILLVEDEEDIRLITKMALEDIGKMTVLSCSRGTEALALADAFQPELFLFDVMMPEMDGPTLLKELRKRPQFAKTAVIFLTAKSQTQEVDEYKKLGALDVIIKPFDPVTLPVQIVERWNHFISQVSSSG